MIIRCPHCDKIADHEKWNEATVAFYGTKQATGKLIGENQWFEEKYRCPSCKVFSHGTDVKVDDVWI